MASFVARKEFTMRDKTYKPGDSVDVTGMADHKVSQLLNQRFIRPSTKPG